MACFAARAASVCVHARPCAWFCYRFLWSVCGGTEHEALLFCVRIDCACGTFVGVAVRFSEVGSTAAPAAVYSAINSSGIRHEPDKRTVYEVVS